jgi:hypothetical protein
MAKKKTERQISNEKKLLVFLSKINKSNDKK